MALVDGSVKDILGQDMSNRECEVWFIPNSPGVRVSGVPGMVAPTEPVKATMASNGTWVADLANTDTFLNEMWYRMQIRWISDTEGAALIDFPEWKVRVTGDGNISEMIDFGGGSGGPGGGPNRNLWWVGLFPPPSQGFLWLYQDPDDPQGTTDPIPELDLGDVVIGGW